MSKMLILCTTLLCATAAHAANKPASELVWTEAEEEGCRGNVCVNNDSNKKPDMFSRLDKTERQLQTDPYSKYDRDSSSTARAGVTFKWD